MSVGIENGQFGLVYAHKIQSRNLIKYFIKTKQIICNRTWQILAFYTYKHGLWLIMEESGAVLYLRVFMSLKQIIEESV